MLPKVGDLYVYVWRGPNEADPWTIYQIVKREPIDTRAAVFENTLRPVVSLILPIDMRNGDVIATTLRGWRRLEFVDVGMMRLKLDNFLREEMEKRSK